MKTATEVAIEIETKARIKAMTDTERQKLEQEGRKLVPKLMKQLGIK